MRMLMNVKLPVGPFNATVKDGTAGAKIKKIMAAMKPEAAYFTEQHGLRGGIFIVNVPDPSKVPALAEPWFLTFEASVEFHIVMSPADLDHSAIDALAKKWC